MQSASRTKDDMGLKEYAAEYSKKTGFPIFVGIEFFSLQEILLHLELKNIRMREFPAQDFIDLVKAQEASALRHIRSATITEVWKRT